MTQRIGLLGGSFDPIHTTHIALAQAAYDQLALDTLAFIPTGQSWQKNKHWATPDQRLAMVKLAIAPYPYMQAWDLDVRRGTPTRTFDTLTELSKLGHKYYWLMGSDQLNNFCTWHRWQELLELMELVVVYRQNEPIHIAPELQQHLDQIQGSLHYLSMPASSVSSTQIRHALALRQLDTCALPANVLQYILEHHLYTE